VHTKVKDAPPIRQKIFHTAMAVSRERSHKLEFGQEVGGWLDMKHKFFDKVFGVCLSFCVAC
jgi:long-subunit acyl-CoA synthetase (AMP-forming)